MLKLLSIFIFFSSFLYPSNFSISGLILDYKTKEPISDVNIFIQNSNIGTITDKKGYFFLSINPKYILINKMNLNIQVIGYEKKVELIEVNRKNIDLGVILLKPKNIEIETIEIHSHKPKSNQISDIIISRSDLNQNLKGNIASTLEKFPNIGINSYGIITSKPSLRGFSGDRFLLTKEGNEIGDLSQSSIDHVIALDMSEVESIEILRGPKSLIYGPNAIGGIVNASLLGSPKARAKKIMLKTMYGFESINNANYGNAIIYLPFSNSQVNLLFSKKGSKNQSSPIGELKNTDSNTENYKLGYTNYLKNGYLNFIVEKFNMNYGIPPNAGGHITGVDIALFKDSHQLNFHKDIPMINFNLLDIKYSFIDYEHQELVNNQKDYHVSLSKKTYNYEINLSSEKNNLGIKINFKDFEPKGFYFTPKTLETESAIYGYKETKLNYFEIDLLNSFRYSFLMIRPELENIQFSNLDSLAVKDRNFNNFSISLGLRKNITKFKFNSWFMYTMRSPRVEELYSDGPHLGTYAYEIGNPNLEIEKIYGLENSLSYSSNLFNFSLITFYNYSPFYYEMTKMGHCDGEWVPGYSHPCAGADFIDWGSGEFGFLYKYNSKGNKAIIKGFEFNLSYKIKSIHLNYDLSFVHGDNLTTNTPLSYMNPMKQILDINHKKKFLNYKLRLLKIHSQDRLGEFETYTPSTFLTDIIIDYKFKNHTLTFQANNVFDKIYYNHLSRIKSITPEPGKNFHFIYKLVI